MTYTLKNLPENIKNIILESHHVENIEEHRKDLLSNKFFSSSSSHSDGVDLFGNLEMNVSLSNVSYTDSGVIWATDNYSEKGKEYGFSHEIHDVSIIVPRVEKNKEEQKKRVKEKAEVFTPSWVCNIQNNLIDDHIIGDGSFNTVSDDQRHWFPSKSPVDFSHSLQKDYSWKKYVMERRLEMACGEGPYLMSPYDTTNGEHIPVRNNDSLFERIGILDRKLRVVTENVDKSLWNDYAFIALCTTFGYEWQGDNLLLARLNFLNTYIEYYVDAMGVYPSDKNIESVAEIASWNIWQMDGLKMVEPESCSLLCNACKNRKRAGHDGKVSVIRFATPDGFEYKSFEDLLPLNLFQK